MESESFYGVTLSEKEPIAQFAVPEVAEEYLVHSYKLIIKQISLGPEAKSGEFNVIQAETQENESKKIVKIPIAVLKVGETRSLRPNVEFPNGSVTFKLVQGTGPVYVCGKSEMNLGEYEDVNMYEEYSDEEDESELELDEEASPQTNGKSNKKK
ncbi:nucleoplasmin-like protein [Drosophila sulfurigaster albostrigata]|uniref:Nucleoplasmin-like protein n=1 Tax=Drosophila albomicans TaxID=7291 RepID=A0A6P8XLH3_DROAB|nr:nucleoplasmin-like protein [Drosophila albomicans]XP_060649422.1 nucleoplasmin-like protein [Drosophila nasuta]XP_062121658.1 nucleoplasmin-like protein [Drosophila sulfurigaster albostrigata]